LKQSNRPSSTQQRRLPQQQLLSQQQLGSSQQQLGSSQQQLGSSQQQLGSQAQDFSQQLQLGSQQHPQPLPSIRSSNPPPKQGLARAMLTTSAPRKFHFIEHRLLLIGTTRAELFADFRQRAMPPHAELLPVVTTDASIRAGG
jgi:hypothetical protein